MINFLDKNDELFTSYYQKILLLTELRQLFGEMYLIGERKIVTDILFIVTNIRIDHHMGAA